MTDQTFKSNSDLSNPARRQWFKRAALAGGVALVTEKRRKRRVNYNGRGPGPAVVGVFETLDRGRRHVW